MKKHLIVPALLLWSLLFSPDPSLAAAPKDTLATIYGKVTEIFEGKPGRCPRATVLMVKFDKEIPDSTYTTSDDDGVFIFKNICPQEVYLKAFSVGKKPVEGLYDLVAGRNAVYFTLEDAPEEIEKAEITAEVPLMKQIKDTVIYNTAAVTTMEGETLAAVLEQLPGFKVSKDEISVDGEKVERTYVNGVLVFGDNAATAVHALNADEVTQVRVYEEQSAVDKRRGIRTGKKNKVLDVTTKESILKLAELGLFAYGGADETGQLRYNGFAGLSYYSEMLLLNGNVSADNINSMYSYNADNEVVYGNRALKPRMDFAKRSAGLSDYTEALGIDASVTKYWKNRDYGNNFTFGYGYSRKYSKSAETVLRDYFANAGNPATYSADTTMAQDVRGMHSFSAMFDLKDTPIKSVTLSLTGEIEDDGRSTLSASKNWAEGAGDTYSRHETYDGRSRDYRINASAMWTDNEVRKVRPEVNLDFEFYHNSMLSWTVDTLATSFDRRQLSSDGFGNGLNARAGVSFETILANDEKRFISLNGNFTSAYDRSKKKQLTSDAFGVEVPVTDMANTYDYTWNMFNNALHVDFNYSARSTTLMFGANFTNTVQMDDERYPSAYSVDRTYWTVSPFILFGHKQLNVEVHVAPAIPSLEQTRNRISDSNPLVLTGGNPGLKPAYNSSFSVRWTQPVAKRMGSLTVSANAECNFRPIVSRTRYFTEDTVLDDWEGYTALSGSRLYTYENALAPAWKTSLNVNGMGLFFKRKLNANMYVAFSTGASPLYYGDELISAEDLSVSGSLNLAYRPVRALKITAMAVSGYTTTSNQVKSLLSRRITSSCSAGVSVIFAKSGNMQANYRLYSVDYIGGAGTDFMSHTLDVGLSWSFLKRTLEVGIYANDLLNTGYKYSSTVSADAAVQTWTPVYGRYFMLGITYLFRKK